MQLILEDRVTNKHRDQHQSGAHMVYLICVRGHWLASLDLSYRKKSETE